SRGRTCPRRAAGRPSGWRARGRPPCEPCRAAVAPPDGCMRRPGAAAGASRGVSWVVVSAGAGELAKASLHGLELASHPLLLRAEGAERAAGIGERRDGRRTLAEGDHLGHELAYLGLVAGGAALIAATGGERVAVERRARSPRRRHGVG